MKWSTQQNDVYDFVDETTNSILIEATAGGGKTTTLVQASKLLPTYKSKQFLAFNMSIVEELKQRLPSGVKCNTFHSLGMNFLSKGGFKIGSVTDYKNMNALDQLYSKEFKEKFKDDYAAKQTVCDIHDFLRLNLLPFTEENAIAISKQYCIAANEEIEYVLKLQQHLDKVNKAGFKKETDIDFIDMIYLPVVNGLVENRDIILVDECQDMSLLQIGFVKQMMHQTTRILAVGDKYQSIYYFGGSSSDSFEQFRELCGTTLPLSVTYRVPKKGVELARQLCPTIEAAEWAKDGSIFKDGTFDDLQHGDFVLCRNELPLIVGYIELIKRGMSARIRGKDLEKKIKRHISLTKGNYIEEVVEHIETDISNYKKKMEKLNPNIDPTKTKGYFDRKVLIEVLEVIQDSFGIETKKELKKRLASMFDEKKQGKFIDMMTIHKSKGLEADNVALIDKWNGKPLIPSIYAATDAEFQQERNLLFVALTRFKNRLTYINL